MGIDRYFELFLTCAIAYFAYSQVQIAKSSSEGSTKQIGQIIVAADRINDAADSFSQSSADISRGVEDAAGKLNMQASAAQKALDQSKDFFIRDERPYLAETTKSAEPPQIFANPRTPGLVQIGWNWHFTNYGKSPAANIRMDQAIRLEQGGFQPSYGSSGKPKGKAHDKGGSQAPTADSFNTVFSAPIERRVAERLVALPNAVAIRIKISYMDLGGRHYSTGICLANLGQGVVAFCDYNYIH